MLLVPCKIIANCNLLLPLPYANNYTRQQGKDRKKPALPEKEKRAECLKCEDVGSRDDEFRERGRLHEFAGPKNGGGFIR